jgi:hypothetical protein
MVFYPDSYFPYTYNPINKEIIKDLLNSLRDPDYYSKFFRCTELFKYDLSTISLPRKCGIRIPLTSFEVRDYMYFVEIVITTPYSNSPIPYEDNKIVCFGDKLSVSVYDRNKFYTMFFNDDYYSLRRDKLASYITRI